MIFIYILLLIIFVCKTYTDDFVNDCNNAYNLKCYREQHFNKSDGDSGTNFKKCQVQNLPKDVNFTVMLDENGRSTSGIVKVELLPPEFLCAYKIALLVDPLINNSEECKDIQSNRKLNNKKEIHTIEKTICPKYNNNETHSTYLRNGKRELTACAEDNAIIWYEYVYTGCYTLRFNFDGNYFYLGNQFLKTDYIKEDVVEPKVRCSYEIASMNNESSQEVVNIASDISILSSSSKIVLGVKMISLKNLNKEDACNRFSKNAILLWNIQMDKFNDVLNNCSLNTANLTTGIQAKTVECNLKVQAPQNMGYCFFIQIIDKRCHKYTLWNPPSKDKVPCAWMQSCTRSNQKINNAIEEIKAIKNTNILIFNSLYCLIIVIFVIIILTLSFVVIIYWRYYSKKVLNIRMQDNNCKFKNDMNAIMELEISKLLKEKLLKDSGIVILYVKESAHFMDLMIKFRNILGQRTGCEIYDWWAPELWNNVATIGGYDWFIRMIRKGCRVIWIDTLKAREILNLQHKRSLNKFENSKLLYYEVDLSDFRDKVFPSIVNYMKFNNQNRENEYQKNYVARFATFNTADKIEDPFANLSPHVRYIIPHHLSKLYNQLSIQENYGENDIEMDKILINKYMLNENSNNL